MSVCIGFGAKEGVCEKEAGTPWTPLWCMECDEERRAYITAQLHLIADRFLKGKEPRP
jgi:hypothetical protein